MFTEGEMVTIKSLPPRSNRIGIVLKTNQYDKVSVYWPFEKQVVMYHYSLLKKIQF